DHRGGRAGLVLVESRALLLPQGAPADLPARSALRSVVASRDTRGERMAAPAFAVADFKVFDVTGFQPRMAEIRERIRPKLEAFGHSLAPAIARATGGDAF